MSILTDIRDGLQAAEADARTVAADIAGFARHHQALADAAHVVGDLAGNPVVDALANAAGIPATVMTKLAELVKVIDAELTAASGPAGIDAQPDPAAQPAVPAQPAPAPAPAGPAPAQAGAQA